MHRSRFISLVGLALLAGLGGCFASHEAGVHVIDAAPAPVDGGHRPDAGPQADGGCAVTEPLPGRPVALSCPATAQVGDAVGVSLTHASNVCCPETAALPLTVWRGRDTPDFGLGGSWSPCSCCLRCACDESTTTQSTSLGPFFAPGPVHVQAGDLSCTIQIVDAPASCSNVPTGRVLVPAAVPAGTPIPIGVEAAGSGGCACTPRLSVPSAGLPSIIACDCCLPCGCVDYGYEGTTFTTLAGPSPWTVTAPDGARTVTAIDPSSCRPAGLVGVGLITPGTGYTSATPSAAWAHVTVEVIACAAAPLPWVRTSVDSTGQIVLTALDCGPPDPADCGIPRTFLAETDVFLGFLSSGDHTLVAGPAALRFSIP